MLAPRKITSRQAVVRYVLGWSPLCYVPLWSEVGDGKTPLELLYEYSVSGRSAFCVLLFHAVLVPYSCSSLLGFSLTPRGVCQGGMFSSEMETNTGTYDVVRSYERKTPHQNTGKSLRVAGQQLQQQ